MTKLSFENFKIKKGNGSNKISKKEHDDSMFNVITFPSIKKKSLNDGE